MKEVIIATKNPGKAKEFKEMFSAYGYEVKTLLDYPDFPDIEETGQTFEENAILKAEAVSAATGRLAIADDSGLVIDALNGRPGVYSARYAGEAKDDQANIEKVLAELIEVPAEKRAARFYCALALAVPNEPVLTVSGTCEGQISTSQQGKNGFGYDPIFFVPSLGRTMAELSPEEKHRISHRGQAIQALKGKLSDTLGGELA
ncbi:XTP/dITP diphosphohydrolase [Bacillus ectoiniformans]|uniref:XTP/dITP diphosphatase n=1 Tax=Bacillus ectoiniformans TaxID=1494429 RepID=UPI00195A35D2|nr:XTP/dITP diphosphatase [Bacillus ectoiniformans]MBM7648907.1 XTP/dITP diphosphohydrolase [Bacillus ectoiniformans]